MRDQFPEYDPMFDLKYGVSQHLLDKESGVIYGSRRMPENGTSGWYLWMGEKTDEPDFFKPLHGKHLIRRYPALFEFLDLPPGYVFLYDTENGYIDIWEDKSLLDEAPDRAVGP